MSEYISQFISMVDGFKMVMLMALIIANALLGIVVSLKNGNFSLKEVAAFLQTRVVPYVVGYFAVGVAAIVEPTLEFLVPTIWAVITATLIGAILQNIKELGINVPDFLAGGK